MGEEPFSQSTAIYNEKVKERLEKSGVSVHVLPRFETAGQAVSASEVRRLLREGKTAEAAELVPGPTAAYLLKQESGAVR